MTIRKKKDVKKKNSINSKFKFRQFIERRDKWDALPATQYSCTKQN